MPSNSYYTALAKATNAANKSILISNTNYNYTAFVSAIAKFDMTKKDIHYLWYEAKSEGIIQEEVVMLKNAEEVFAEKTASAASVKNFMAELAQYTDKPKVSRKYQKYQFTYSKWFRDNTNAKGFGKGTQKLVPESVDWNNFKQICNQKFNYTLRDLTRFFREAE